MSAYCVTWSHPKALQAWHTIALLHSKPPRPHLTLHSIQNLVFKEAFWCFYSQIPALVKPGLKSRDHEAAGAKLCRLCTKPVEEQESSLPAAKEMSQLHSHLLQPQGKQELRQGSLLTPNVYPALCTQGNTFWNTNSLQTASHTWGSLNSVYKVSLGAVLTSRQHHGKDTGAKVENGAGCVPLQAGITKLKRSCSLCSILGN